MKNITSIVDLFEKSKKDIRYKWLLLHAYKCNVNIKTPVEIISYEKSVKWIINWVDEYVGVGKRMNSCKRMVDFINLYVKTTKDDSKYTLPPMD